jgi:hypothetical protein
MSHIVPRVFTSISHVTQDESFKIQNSYLHHNKIQHKNHKKYQSPTQAEHKENSTSFSLFYFTDDLRKLQKKLSQVVDPQTDI